MTFDLKKRIVLVTLAVVTIWPIVHHVLARTMHLHPQKGLAWSMYCVPSRSIGTRILSLDNGRPLPVDELGAAERRGFERAKTRFVEMRAMLGTLARPRALARAAFDVFPDLNGVRIVVHQAGVDASSAVLVMEKVEGYDYRRDDLVDE